MQTTKRKQKKHFIPKKPNQNKKPGIFRFYFHGVIGGRRVDHDTANAGCASDSNLAVPRPLCGVCSQEKKKGQVDENNADESCAVLSALRRNLSPVAPQKKTRESFPVPLCRSRKIPRCCPMESSQLTRRVRSTQTGDRDRDRDRERSERHFYSSRLSLTKLVAPSAAPSLPARVAGPPRLALFVSHVAVPRRCARELRAAPRAVALCRRARLFALVPQQVAKRGELPPVTPVLPALRFRPRV